MTQRKVFTVVIALVLGTFLMAQGVFAEDTIKVGVVGPRTGPAAATGQAFEEGIQLALDVINNQMGGVLGKKMEVVFEDTGGVPEKAASGFEKLITKDHVVVTVGESHSSCALAEVAIAERYKQPLIIAEAWADDITAQGNKYVFRAGPCNSGVVNDYILGFVKEYGFKRVAIVAENTDWGLGIKKLAEDGLKKMGIENMVVETSRDSNDHYAELNKIKNFKPDLVLAFVYGFGVHSLIAQAHEVGLVPQEALLLEGAGPPSLWPEYWQNVGDAGDLELFVSRMHAKVDLNEKSKAFRESYEKAFNKAPTDYKSRSIYDVLLIAADAINRAGGTDPDKIVDALEKTDMKVAGGTVKFGDEKGTFRYHQWQPPMLIIQWQNREQVVVYPVAAKTGELKRK